MDNFKIGDFVKFKENYNFNITGEGIRITIPKGKLGVISLCLCLRMFYIVDFEISGIILSIKVSRNLIEKEIGVIS